MNDGTLCNQKHLEKIEAVLVQLTAKLIGVEGVGYSVYIWDVYKEIKRKLSFVHSYPLFSAKTSISLRLSIMLVFWTLFMVV